jgi:zinc and cadmium transporter
LGALLFYVGASHLFATNPAFLGSALAFCAGTFLCIACADLLPELQFHAHDRLRLSLALLSGIGVAVLIGQFEHSGHDHHHDQPAAATSPFPNASSTA